MYFCSVLVVSLLVSFVISFARSFFMCYACVVPFFIVGISVWRYVCIPLFVYVYVPFVFLYVFHEVVISFVSLM